MKSAVWLNRTYSSCESNGEIEFNDLIIAKDYGNPVQSSNASIKLIIYDVNNHNPILIQPEDDLEVLEQSEIGTVVAKLEYTDDDPCFPNNKVSMRIKDSDFSKYFNINQNNQLIVTDDTLGIEDDSLGTVLPQ